MEVDTRFGSSKSNRFWLEMLGAAKDLEVEIVGVKLVYGRHEPDFCYDKMLAMVRMIFAVGKCIGHPMTNLDIGTLLLQVRKKL